jgi:hypothetical protein
MWNTSLPPEVVVSMFSVRLRKPTLRAERAFTVSMRWRRERPRRSSRHTTTVSPGRTWSKSLASSIRSASEPEAESVKTR